MSVGDQLGSPRVARAGWGWQGHDQKGGESMLAGTWGEPRMIGHQLHRGHTGGFSQFDLAHLTRFEEYVH